jgi:hypothetical protein
MTDLQQLRRYRYQLVATTLIGVIFLALAYFEGLRVRPPIAPEPHLDAMPHSVAVAPATVRTMPSARLPHLKRSGERLAD